MNHHLLAISIGPVQDFIAAARRTADLYAGSQLLVEIAKTIARTIQSRGGELIFPAGVTKNGKPDISDGPNKIVAEITNGNPQKISEACREAALEYLRGDGKGTPGVWGEAKKKIPKSDFDEDRADKQIENFLEFYSAWVEWYGQSNSYENARVKLDRLLAGRKALRDFQQPEKIPGRPKSPLDPSRDCVLDIKGTQAVPPQYRKAPLWLKQRETLDAVSMLKRIRGITEGPDVPSTSLMAFRAIEDEVEKKAPAQISFLREKAKKAGRGIDLGDLMFESRSDEEELKDRGLSDEDLRQIKEKRKEVLKAVGRSECPAYYAILVADGDKMGALIGALGDIEQHRKFSAALSTFAQEAENIVHKRNGHLIYSGGDDVLALLPINKVLQCASDLANEFSKRIGPFRPPGNTSPLGTLSVGVAIVHHMDPLLVSLEHARQAERAAKSVPGKNALAVALHTRGGEPLLVSAQWDAKYSIADWTRWIDAFRGDLSRGFPYELRTLAREFRDSGLPSNRLTGEAIRILRRKKGAMDQDETKEPLKSLIEALKQNDTHERLEKFGNKLTIARFLSTYEVKP